MQAFALELDRIRVTLLRISLRMPLLRQAYSLTSVRLFAGFLFFCLFYAPIALRRPDLLLFWGPFVFGYPHLLASYRFLQPRERLLGLAPFVFFALLTAVSMALHFALVRFALIPELPFGAWELVVACIAAILVRRRPLVLCGVGAFLLWKFSWHEPLVFVAMILLFHNWVAFFQWILLARGSGRVAALAASGIFGLIHLAVFGGYADFLMPLMSPEIFAASVHNTGATLAPWSRDLTIWYRAVVLYAFGLSLHYFVWLKALAECRLRAPQL